MKGLIQENRREAWLGISQSPFFHRIWRRERDDANAPSHAHCFSKKCDSLKDLKNLYGTSLESVNSTISYVSSIEKTSFFYHFQVLHVSTYLQAHNSSKAAPLHVQTYFSFWKLLTSSITCKNSQIHFPWCCHIPWTKPYTAVGEPAFYYSG